MKNFNFIPIVGVLCLLIVLSVFQISGCNENNTDKDKFPQPEVRKSQNGILRTNIEVSPLVALACGSKSTNNMGY